MPSSTPELQAKFTGMDVQAIDELIAEGFTISQEFIIHPPTKNHKYTDRQYDAIDYLIQEWDYGFCK